MLLERTDLIPFDAFAAAAGNNDNRPTLGTQRFKQCAWALDTKCTLLLLFDDDDNDASATTIVEPKTNEELQCIFGKGTFDLNNRTIDQETFLQT